MQHGQPIQNDPLGDLERLRLGTVWADTARATRELQRRVDRLQATLTRLGERPTGCNRGRRGGPAAAREVIGISVLGSEDSADAVGHNINGR